MDIVKPAWQYIGEMREEGVVWFNRNPHAFPLGTQYYAISGDSTDMTAEVERLRFKLQRSEMECVCAKREVAASHAREEQLRDELFAVLMQDMSGDKARLKVEEFKSDTSALEAMIFKAGEVMRERCAHEADPFELKNALATDIAKGIRALPGVTLDDLK